MPQGAEVDAGKKGMGFDLVGSMAAEARLLVAYKAGRDLSMSALQNQAKGSNGVVDLEVR
jgi:hypothetical protein